jgi:hypothetical protein
MVGIGGGERARVRLRRVGRRLGRSASFGILSAAGILLACGGGDGPSGPPPAPEVTSVTPAPARAGDQVTIVGDHFGTSAAGVTVSFNGIAATIVSVTNTSIVAIVPDIPPGSATVVVTVDGRSSGGIAVSVLRGLPAITSVSPSSVRAGGTLTITGRNFVALARVQPAGAALEVLLDDQPLVPQSVTSTQVVVQIPLATDPGSHQLRLRLDEELSNTFSFQVEIFTVTGTYLLEGTVTFNDCPPGTFFPVGTEVVSNVSVTDNRPSLTIQLTAPGSSPGPSHPGTLITDGSFQVSLSEQGGAGAGGVTSTISGRFVLASNGIATFSGTNEIVDGGDHCRVQVDFTATRTSTTPSLRPALRSPALAGRSAAEASWGTAWRR